MAIQVQGNGGVVAEVDGTTYRALRITGRPVDYGALGAYAINLVTGIMAAALGANSEIFQARWTDATRLAVIFALESDGAGGIAAFTAGATKFEAMIARAWSADGSGGTAATLTGNNQKMRTSMATTLFGAIRAASTAALTAGTKTLDAQGCGATNNGVTATAGAQVVPSDPLLSRTIGTNGGGQPVVLVQNEGMIVRATVPATGTWTGGVSMKWAELTSY